MQAARISPVHFNVSGLKAGEGEKRIRSEKRGGKDLSNISDGINTDLAI